MTKCSLCCSGSAMHKVIVSLLCYHLCQFILLKRGLISRTLTCWYSGLTTKTARSKLLLDQLNTLRGKVNR